MAAPTLPPNTHAAYDYFIGQGFTPAQSSGIVGNLIQESGVNPEAVQYAGGPGRGIAQWSVGGRWQPRLMTGNVAVDLANQLAYIMQELNTTPAYGLAALKQATTPAQAAQIFGTDYERYGVEGNRVLYAQQVYDAYGSTPVPTPPPTEEDDMGYILGNTGQATYWVNQGHLSFLPDEADVVWAITEMGAFNPKTQPTLAGYQSIVKSFQS